MPDTRTISALVVDQNPGLREVIARFLEKRGCWVTVATSHASALEAVRRQVFDVVVSDALGLYEEALRLRPELRGRFVMMMSGEPRPAPETMKLLVDSEQLLVKPLSLTELWRRIGDIIERARRPASGYVTPPEVEAVRETRPPDAPTAE